MAVKNQSARPLRAGRARGAPGPGRGAAGEKEGGVVRGKLLAGAMHEAGLPSAAMVGWPEISGASRAGAHNFRAPFGTLCSPETCRAPLLDPSGSVAARKGPRLVATGSLRLLRPGLEPSGRGLSGGAR